MPSEPPTLRDRVALVTGASGGIGRAISLGLAAEGAAVAVAYSSGAEPARRLAAEIADAGGRAVTVGGDLRDSAAPDTLVEQARSVLGEIDVLVNNAGLGSQRTLAETTLQDFDDAYAVNVRAPFRLAQLTVPGMVQRGFGRVLMMSSVAGSPAASWARTTPPRRPLWTGSRTSWPPAWPAPASPSTRWPRH